MLDTSGYHGGGDQYRHAMFRAFRYTEGVQYVAAHADAYWLMDAIFSHQITKAAQREEFQVWTLKVDGKCRATLTMTDGNFETPRIQQKIAFTDFPEPEIVLWLVDKCLMLPSEY